MKHKLPAKEKNPGPCKSHYGQVSLYNLLLDQKVLQHQHHLCCLYFTQYMNEHTQQENFMYINNYLPAAFFFFESLFKTQSFVLLDFIGFLDLEMFLCILAFGSCPVPCVLWRFLLTLVIFPAKETQNKCNGCNSHAVTCTVLKLTASITKSISKIKVG